MDALAPSPAAIAVDTLAHSIRGGRMVTAAHLQSVMECSHGAAAATGEWSWRDAYDVTEAAFLTTIPTLLHGYDSDASRLKMLTAAARRLPTQSKRSEQQVRLQQFSTPSPYGFIASRAAAHRAGDVTLESSAGIGVLATFAKLDGASLIINEIDPSRRALLELVLGCQAHGHDGALIDDLLPMALEPTVVLMNPPFTSSIGRADDPEMAEKHLMAALKRLCAGGRLVAIMPLSFGPDRSGRWRDIARMWSIRLRLEVSGRVYRKHGTNVDTALVVIDKIDPDGEAPQFERVDELTAALPLLADLPTRADPVRRFCRAAPAITRLPPRRGPARPRRLITTTAPESSTLPVPVKYRVLEPPRQGLVVSEIYTGHVTQRIDIADAKPHPTALVESTAMASVLPPSPSYIPALPARLVTGGVLSAAQLETVIQAGDAHARFLPGYWSLNEIGDGLIPMAEGDGDRHRTGFFLGDGTGCGKGRQVAAIMLDNFLQGRRRAVWLSVNAPLMEDALRDWTAIGGAPTDIRSLSSWKPNEPIAMESGILFMTYATLRSQSLDGETRLQQILDWLGDDFDGVIAFDEAHAMGNAAGGKGARGRQKPSRQGLVGLCLQNRLPAARILYVSATGATTVDNLAYATRLGLWGDLESPFASREQFVDAMVKGGVAAMEVVARDLKALGLYTARSLSFEGVEYDVVEHTLTTEQRAIYDAYAGAFQIIHRHLGKALEATNVVGRDGKVNNGNAKSAAHSRFESVKQRFFNHIIAGMKTPTLIRTIKADLEAGVSAVVQIVSTGEAMLDRRLASLTPDDMLNLHIDLTPREAVMTYLQDAFPVVLHREIETESGGITTEIVTDSEGNPVLSREAVAARDALIEHLALLAPVPTALDQLVWAFGPEAIAEVTGRSKRPVYRGEGQRRRLVIETRSSSNANTAETTAFQHGEKRVLVFSGAGGTGRSYHADLEGRNQERRHHYLLEPGWRADAAIQGLGRTHRSNQAVAPLFRLVASDVAGEKRFTSTIARRLNSLGALTKGQRQTGGQGMFRDDDNMESVYANQALRLFYRAIACGNSTSIDLARFIELTALTITDPELGCLLDELPPMSRLLNRLLAVDLDRQSAMFDELVGLIEARVAAARQAGTLDVGVETIRAEGLNRLSADVLVTCPTSGAETVLSTIERRRRVNRRSAAELHAAHRDGKMLQQSKTGKVALAAPTRSLLDDDGSIIQQFRLIRPGSSKLVTKADLVPWLEIGKQDFDRLWDEEVHGLPEMAVDHLQLLSGMLLFVWKLLPEDNQRVYRLELDDGTAMLGRVFDKDEAGLVRARLCPTAAMDASSLMTAVLDEGRRIELARGTALNKRLIGGKPRLEIESVTSALVDGLKVRGCFTEMIDWRLRVFIPLHEDCAETVAVLDKVLEVLPIA